MPIPKGIARINIIAVLKDSTTPYGSPKALTIADIESIPTNNKTIKTKAELTSSSIA